MPMPSYPVICQAPACSNRAVYKVAARWSDGITEELKTYSLACPDCLRELYRRAQIQCEQCRLAPGEALDAPAIYLLNRGSRDRQLIRCEEREADLVRGISEPGAKQG